MRKNDLSVFKLEQEGFKITLKRGIDFPAAPAQPLPPSFVPPVTPAPNSSQLSAQPAPAKETLRDIKSPMVGTFYLAPSPDSPPYVTVGQEVTEDSVVCIVEAMKVMNEIKSEFRGAIAEVVAEDGKPVEYGQVLFRLR